MIASRGEFCKLYFLRAVEHRYQFNGYIDRQVYCNALKSSGVIGSYNIEGEFIENKTITTKYQDVIPLIADSLALDTRDPLYGHYKVATLDKIHKTLYFEWRVANVLGTRELSLDFGLKYCDLLGSNVIFVDMQGPAYDVIIMETVDTFLSYME